MNNLPIDAIVACDAEVERLRARVAELEGQHKGLVIQNAILRSRPDLPADRIPAADRVAKLEDDRDRWKAEALAARHFISMGRIEAWQPDGFHPGIPSHVAYKTARAANGEVGQ